MVKNIHAKLIQGNKASKFEYGAVRWLIRKLTLQRVRVKEESLHLDLKMFLALGMKIADHVDHNAISLSVTLSKGRISS